MQGGEGMYTAHFELGDMLYTVEISSGNLPQSKPGKAFLRKQFASDKTSKKWFKKNSEDDDTLYDKMYDAAEQFPSIMIDFHTQEKGGGMSTDRITNTGGEIKVFATVVNIVKRIVQEVNPLEIYFEASRKKTEPSRVKLYDRLAKTLSVKFGYQQLPAKEFGGYILINKKYMTS
jgi:hypothetical protein